MGLSDDIKKINAELDKLRKELGKNPLKPFDEKDIDRAREALGGLRNEIREMSSDLDYVSNSFKESVNELSRQNTFLTDARNSLKGIANISDKVLQYRKGEISLSEKQLKNLQQQAKAKFDSLQNDVNSGELRGKNLQEAQDALNKQGLFNKELELTADIQKQVNKDIGLLGTGIGGVSQLLSKMGFGDMSQPLQDAIDKTKNARVQIELNKATQSELNELISLQGKNIDDLSKEELERLFDLEEKYSTNVDKNKQLLQSFKDINKELDSQTSKYKNIGNALKDQLTKANLLDYVYKSLTEAFGTSQKGIGDLAKGLGMSASRATVMRQEFGDIANSSMNANLSVKAMQDTQLAVGQALGTNVKLNIEDNKTMTDLVKKTGLQHSELIGIEKLSLATGKSLDDNVEAALGGATAYAMQNKLVVDNNKVLREVNSASSSLKLSLGGSVEALGEAVVKVQQLGMDLKTAEQISSSMLNFESSIEAELEAELLTGKNLNMERARQLALEGDIAGAAKEMADQLGSAEEFGKMNVIQQEALAKSVGLSRDALADSLIERKALAAMSAKDGISARERYDELVKEGHTRDEIQKMVGKDAMAQLEQQSAQEKFNNSVEKLKEIFVQVMDALAPVFDVFSSIAEVVLPAINFLLTPFINGIKWISKYAEDILITFGSIYAVQKLMTVTEGILLTIQASKVASKTTELGLGGALLANLGFQNAAEMYKLTLMTGGNTLAAIRAGLEATILGSIIAQGFGIIKNIGKLAIENTARLIGMSTALATNAAVTFGVGVAIAVAAAAAGYAAVKSMKDGMIGPDGEMVVSGPKGSIQLDKDDSIIAGTNLLGGDKKSNTTTTQQPTQTTQASVDMTQTNALLQQLISAVTTGGNVMLDGQKVGEALKIGSFQTQ